MDSKCPSIDSKSLSISVTAIKTLKERFSSYTLVGLGSQLEIYHDGKLKFTKALFDSTSSSIHGFRHYFLNTKDTLQIAIFGGKHFCVAKFSLRDIENGKFSFFPLFHI